MTDGSPSSPRDDTAAFADVRTTGVGRWLVRHVRAGSRVIDVGANVGNYTALASELAGPAGHVFAFEPAPTNARRLRARFEGVGHVSVFERAVGDVSRNVRLYLDATNEAQHSLGSHNVGRAGGAIKIPQVALDDCPALETADVVKIDAQGCELKAIQGARGLIARSRPFITLELWPYGLRNLRSDPMDVLTTLRAFGYRLHKLSAEGVLRSEEEIVRFLSEAGRWDHINIAATPDGIA